MPRSVEWCVPCNTVALRHLTDFDSVGPVVASVTPSEAGLWLAPAESLLPTCVACPKRPLTVSLVRAEHDGSERHGVDPGPNLRAVRPGQPAARAAGPAPAHAASPM